MNYKKKCIRFFWNSLALIDHNFGTKSPFDLKPEKKKKKKKKTILKLRFCSFLLCYNLSCGSSTQFWNPGILYHLSCKSRNREHARKYCSYWNDKLLQAYASHGDLWTGHHDNPIFDNPYTDKIRYG